MDGSTAESSLKKQNQRKNEDMFHVIHKVPSGDGPYVRAKHAQLVQKDAEAAIVWFWKAINAGDRVDSALKDMAVVMKQLDRTEEAIEAIKSFRVLCPKQAQESLDNVLIDLYKKCGRIDEQILLLKQKLRMIYLGEAFNGKQTKTARSHGKKFQVSIKQETSRILGNLAWAYMQKSNYIAAEVIYRKAQMIEADCNKAINLCVSLMKQLRYEEARLVIEDVINGKIPAGSNDFKTRIRAFELLEELEANSKINNKQPSQTAGNDGVLDVRNNISNRKNMSKLINNNENGGKEEDEDEDDFVEELDRLLKNVWGGAQPRTKRLPIFEEISAYCRDQIAC